MKERGVLFSGEMVRAILDGRKTQTRRVIRPQPIGGCGGAIYNPSAFEPDRGWYFDGGGKLKCPYGKPGDLLWMRETWATVKGGVYYKQEGSNNARVAEYCGWRSPIHMRKADARLWLRLTDVRVERVQDITHHDALAEGVAYDVSKPDGAPVPRFRALWDSINTKRGYSWDVNPFCWVLTFEREEKP